MQDEFLDHFEWNLPLPIEERALFPWPKDVFPEPFETFAVELARSTETPIELSAMSTLAVMGACSQKKYEVKIKADYVEPVNVWGIAVLPPASRKSRVHNEATLPLKSWEREQYRLVEPLLRVVESQQKTMEARLKELRTKAAKTIKEDDYQRIQEQIEGLERTKPDLPVCPQLWTADVTPEHLGTIMAVNGEAMAVLSDEGGIFDILGGLYSDGRANIDLFLQAHAAGPVRVDRGSRSPIIMERAVLTFGLTVQPQVIKTICGNKTFRGRGLLGRFLYVIPKSNIGHRTFCEEAMQSAAVNSYQDAVRAILEHPMQQVNGRLTQHTLHLSPEAYKKWLEYAQTIELMMGEEVGYLAHITDWAGKLPGAVARIAALLHIMRYAYGKPWEHKISLEDMQAAAKIGHALTSHALAVFDLLQEDDAQHVARAIYEWIKKNKYEHFTMRECQRENRRFKRNRLRSGLDILKEHEILREHLREPVGGGRKSELFFVNPLTIEAPKINTA